MAPLLRIPPFPGAKLRHFRPHPARAAETSIAEVLQALCRERVGGSYWSAPPSKAPRGIVARSRAVLPLARELAGEDGNVILWPATGDDGGDLTGSHDPWSVLEIATGLICTGDDEVLPIARLLDVPVYLQPGPDEVSVEQAVTGLGSLADPFTGEPMSMLQAIELCGFWRRLIESNRDLIGALGFAFWKQESVAPLLWNGAGPLPFWRSVPTAVPAGAVAIWRSKAKPEDIDSLESRGTMLVEVEDGFLRSAGLGADCVPPLSVTVDRLGPYFDHAQASELEELLQNCQFGADVLDRARRLRKTIVAAGLGKYERGGTAVPRLGGDRRHILIPGQVEDDRSVLTGGLGLSNLALLERVRRHNPDAFLLYKPHPDVEAGHRRGAIPQARCEALCDQMVADLPIASLLDMVDEVHVNTSLAGFEALLRGKPVTTHGVPFYAGWGLTTDLGPVPDRRSARPSLDELVAATLLSYPRYLDPVTGLPCPAEVVVDRLCNAQPTAGLLVRARRLQGSLSRQWRSWRS